MEIVKAARGSAVLAVVLLLVLPARAQTTTTPPRWPGEHWLSYASPEEAGFSTPRLRAAEAYYRTLQAAAFLVVRRGAVVAAFGDVERRYMCHSVRKSLLSALYGVGVDAGDIDLERNLAEIGIDDLEPGLTPTEQGARIVDLLCARSGIYRLAAYEAPITKPRRGSHAPGTFWFYNNWDFNALLTIYERETGTRFFEQFAEKIARPIGMEDFRVRDGYYHLEREKSVHPAYPFRMSARDLARVGVLFLNRGLWREERVLSEEWVRTSTQPWSPKVWKTGEGYGYLWWIAGAEPFATHGMYSALGTGEQGLDVIPGLEMVCVLRTDTYAQKRVEHEQHLDLVRLVLAACDGDVVAEPRLVAMPMTAKQRVPTTGAVSPASIAGDWTTPTGDAVTITIEAGEAVAHLPDGHFGLEPCGGIAWQLEDSERIVHLEPGKDGARGTWIDEPMVLDAAQGSLARRELDRALMLFEIAARFYPGSARTLESLAAVHEARGEPARAIECLEQALALDPSLESARQQLGRLRAPGK